ncbi:MAG: Ppx/GppA family phosphatase [Alphaproteobacteria bacterium]|nr:Ppx/GppA family phosphatase [Alphaproteobacteria bacterium]
MARGPLARREPTQRVAVIDIGSNSIRLVVFDRPWRAFVAIFNEKVLCGLGRGLGETGRLNPDGIALALPNLVRFARLAEAMDVGRLDLFATAAVRDATDGASFVAEVERRCGHRVRILSGEEEARLSAQGVVAGIPDADGLAGDLGGGSLELVEIDRGRPGDHATLALGPFRLMERFRREPARTIAEIDAALGATPWLDRLRGRTFYPVGGAWRGLARIRMAQIDHPLRIIHTYAVARKELEALSRLIGTMSARSLAQLAGLSRRRIETLPLAAIVLERVLRHMRPKRVVFSAYGLREGYMFDLLDAGERRRDPLIAAAEDIARREGRFGDLGDDLVRWTDALFAGEGPETARLRHAACHLSDLAWRSHPDYRAEQAMLHMLRAPFVGLDHPGRAFLAVTAYARYEGIPEPENLDRALSLLEPDARRDAIRLGLALRLAYTISGGARDILALARLEMDEGSPRLVLPDEIRVPGGDAVERRFNALARSFDAAGARILS